MTWQSISAEWTLAHLSKLSKEQPGLVYAGIKQMLSANPDLVWSLVISAYLDEEINLGKAAELLEIHELELRQQFLELGVPLRLGPADTAQVQAEIQTLKIAFGGQEPGEAS